MTGGTGFIGQHFLAKVGSDHEIFVISRNSGPLGPAKVVLANLEEPNFSKTLPNGIEVVIHLAQSRDYRQFPERAAQISQVNISATIELASWARSAGVKKFIYASSASVYGPSLFNLHEGSRLAPTNFYGRTKLVSEQLLENFSPYFQLVFLRLFTVYGPGQRAGLVADILRRVDSGTPVEIGKKHGMSLSPLFVEDAAERLVTEMVTANKSNPKVSNVFGPKKVSVRKIAKTIGSLLGKDPIFRSLGVKERNLSDYRSSIFFSSKNRNKTNLRRGLQLLMASKDAE